MSTASAPDLITNAEPANPVDHGVTVLIATLEVIQQERDAAGFITEACDLRMGITFLRALNSPKLVRDDSTRLTWRRRCGQVNETCTYLLQFASDPKRCGAHAETVRNAVATLRRLYDELTVTPATA